MENTVSTNLFNLLVTKDLEPEILDASGREVTDPKDADLLSFDFKTEEKNYGTVVVLLGNDNELEVYYGDNLGRAMESNDRSRWYDFLAQIKNFATRNLLNFRLNNINRLKYTMQGMSAIKEGLFEGYYGRKNVSYSDQPKKTRLMIQHNRNLAEGEPRWRSIERLYVETADGERFCVPSRSLSHGRMLARHISEGGNPYDAFGHYIGEIVNDIGTLSKFIRACRGKHYDGAAGDIFEAAIRHYSELKDKARRIISRRGYLGEREQFDPATITDGGNLTELIRTAFIEQSLDQRIESALPVLSRLPEAQTIMKEVNEFETFMNGISEGTWSMPETPLQLEQLRDIMSQELVVGPDATNATEQLYDVIGDDELFDRLEQLAEKDPDADARPLIQSRLQELGLDIGTDFGTDFGVAAADDAQTNMGEDLDTDGVMMTRPSNMSSESRDSKNDLRRLLELARLG